MNATHEAVGAFVGNAHNAVAAIVGPEAATCLIRIDLQHLAHGQHWRWINGEQIFTSEGLGVIAEQLRALGFAEAAVALATETRRRADACTPPARADLSAPKAHWWDDFDL